MDLVDNKYWNESYIDTQFAKARRTDQIKLFIEKYIPFGNGKVLEIGCFPGRYLAILGELGYELNGIDINPNTEIGLKNWLSKEGYNIGMIKDLDYHDLSHNQKYDVVSSFGFIEHFSNFEEVLIKHCDLVADGGYLLITTPNFYGSIQNFLHKLLDKKNYNRHNVKAMNPYQWKEIVKMRNFQVIYSGYFGYFNFWAEDLESKTNMQKSVIYLILKTLPITSRIFPNNNKNFAPFCGLVAKKINH